MVRSLSQRRTVQILKWLLFSFCQRQKFFLTFLQEPGRVPDGKTLKYGGVFLRLWLPGLSYSQSSLLSVSSNSWPPPIRRWCTCLSHGFYSMWADVGKFPSIYMCLHTSTFLESIRDLSFQFCDGFEKSCCVFNFSTVAVSMGIETSNSLYIRHETWYLKMSKELLSLF